MITTMHGGSGGGGGVGGNNDGGSLNTITLIEPVITIITRCPAHDELSICRTSLDC